MSIRRGSFKLILNNDGQPVTTDKSDVFPFRMREATDREVVSPGLRVEEGNCVLVHYGSLNLTDSLLLEAEHNPLAIPVPQYLLDDIMIFISHELVLFARISHGWTMEKTKNAVISVLKLVQSSMNNQDKKVHGYLIFPWVPEPRLPCYIYCDRPERQNWIRAIVEIWNDGEWSIVPTKEKFLDSFVLHYYQVFDPQWDCTNRPIKVAVHRTPIPGLPIIPNVTVHSHGISANITAE